MKKQSLKLIAWILGIMLVSPMSALAGNVQRAGQAGASELLINPWARSSGLAGANAGSIRGLESIYFNIAGTAFINKTELIFARTEWMSGSDIGINAFGFSQKLGETGVLTMAVTSFDFGEIPITTVDRPEGGGGNFHPQYTNISLAYAKAFSNSIYGGMVVKIINQSISDVTASGVALDAGIQYVTGANDQIKFGMSMKNVGPTMKYTGDGMSFRGNLPTDVEMTIEQRSADFELPSLIMISGAYDFKLSEKNILQASGTFISNSFTRDQFAFGLEYSFKKMLILRGGLLYEEGLFDKAKTVSVFAGPTGGLSVQIPMNKEKGSVLSIDYSYRTTNPFNGVHSIGARVSL